MTIRLERTSLSTAVMFIEGRLDTGTVPLLERKIKQWEDVSELVLDFSKLDYISSMGLRVLLQAQKLMHGKKKKLTIRNLTEAVRSVFEMTGFINLMIQEEKFVVIRKEMPDMVLLYLIGQMDTAAVSPLEEELFQLRKQHKIRPDPVAVVLDMERLTDLPDTVCGILQRILENSAWPKRKLSIRNAPGKILKTLEANNLGYLAETS